MYLFLFIYLFIVFPIRLIVSSCFRYCILGIIYVFMFRYVCKAPETNVLIDRSLYKHFIITIIT